MSTAGDAVPAGDDEARLADYATALADGIDVALPGWVERSVARVMEEHGRKLDPDTTSAATRAAQRARDEIGPEIRALLAADIDDQRRLAAVDRRFQLADGHALHALQRLRGALPCPRSACCTSSGA